MPKSIRSLKPLIHGTLSFVMTMSLQTVQAYTGLTGGGVTNPYALGASAGWNGGVWGGAGVNQMWGTGAWGGMQACPWPTSRGTNAIKKSDIERQAQKDLQKAERELDKVTRERDRAERDKDRNADAIGRYFDSDIASFLIKTHIGNGTGQKCDDYRLDNDCPLQAQGPRDGDEIPDGISEEEKKTYWSFALTRPRDKHVIIQSQNQCKNKTEVPARLIGNWNRGNEYCNAKSEQSRGELKATICQDKDLGKNATFKSTARSVDQISKCQEALSKYRESSIKYNEAQAKVIELEAQIEAYRTTIDDERENALYERQKRIERQLEAGCPNGDCYGSGRDYEYEKPKRDWLSIVGAIGVGIGLYNYGKKYDRAAMEYQAQLGYPPEQGYPTGVSLGFPFIQSGLYGAINGGGGFGAFGCANGIGGGGNPWGSMGLNGPFGGPGGVFGPYAAGNFPFGYPANMFGTPWGGGAFMPGYGPGGIMAGPNGGWPYGVNGQLGIGTPINGWMAPGNAIYGGLAINGGIAAPGVPMPGFQVPGGPIYGGLAVNGGIAINGGIPAPGFQTGFQIPGLAVNGGIAINGGIAAPFGQPANNPQLQLQLLQQQQQQVQMQMQMQQQALQQQMQYYQAQVQAQMAAAQRQAAVQQQAAQVQMQIYELQMRLQQLMAGASINGGLVGGVAGGVGISGGISGGINLGVGGAVNFGIAAPNPGFVPGANFNGGIQWGVQPGINPGVNPGVPVGSPTVTPTRGR